MKLWPTEIVKRTLTFLPGAYKEPLANAKQRFISWPHSEVIGKGRIGAPHRTAWAKRGVLWNWLFSLAFDVDRRKQAMTSVPPETFASCLYVNTPACLHERWHERLQLNALQIH